MKKISDLYTEIYEDESTKEPKKFISSLEPYVEYLMTANFDNYDDQFKATRLIADYSITISSSGFIKKALPFLNRAIELFHSDKNYVDKDLMDEPLYESLIWKRGETNYNLKNMLAATKDFKMLVPKWPENDRYKNWYNASTSYRLKQIEWVFISIIILYFLLDLSIDDKHISFYYGYFFPILGFITAFFIRISRKIK